MSETTGEISETRGEVEVEWRIANVFSEVLSNAPEDAFHKSPEFNFMGMMWYLVMKVSPHKDIDSSSDWIGLYIMRVSYGPLFSVSYRLGLKDAEGRKIHLVDGTAAFDKYSGRGASKFLLRPDLVRDKSQMAPSDILTVTCSLRRSDPNVVARAEKLSQDLLELMIGGEDSDVTISVKGAKYSAHRNILGARTPVFASMFKHEMTEKTTGVVDIDDCEGSTFWNFLKYVYTGTLENLSRKNLVALYEIADKYQVDELKADCLEGMKNALSVDSFCDVFTLALRHEEKELKKMASEFFSDKMEEITETAKWRTFMDQNLALANELLQKSSFINEKK